MRTVLRRLGQTLPAAAAMLTFVACGSTTPTAATAAATTVQPLASSSAPSSITVQGTVVDSANRPLSNIEVECMGDVQCAPFGTQVSEQDGPDHGVKTNADGAYLIVATHAGSGGTFLMGASGLGYEVQFRNVAFPASACSSDQAGCAVSVNFALTPRAQ
jgi:hypothetical protein